MPEPLGSGDFAPFFAAVHGCAPFAWQQALVEHVLAGTWPQVIDVPTGLGKTAVVDVAVFALAAQAHLPAAERTAPIRTFVAVDRRVIVDQTHERAKALRAALDESADEVVRLVARALRRLSAGSSRQSPLEVVRMRGGTTWAARWLASPAQPAVVTGTIDQLGSRLLFRGYGVSANQRPIDAALCGADSLLILDEAHLSFPFVRTVLACHAYEDMATHPVLARRARPVLLSATPPDGGGGPTGVFRLDPGAEVSDAALARLGAERRLHLIDLVTKAKPEQALPQLASALANLAQSRIAEEGVRRVAVVCNTVGLARLVHGHLASSATADVALITGRCRPVDRERIDEQWLWRLDPDERDEDEEPLVVVATQTIEVGADLDVDALVTEAAPLDALLQRLGRLDRRGRRGRSDAHLVRVASLHGGAETMVYGEATSRTWEWLCEHSTRPRPVAPAQLPAALRAAPTLDLGYRSLAALLSPEERRELSADPVEAPVVLGPILDAWARTSPAPEPDQDVAPFLHGLSRARRVVSVCWRAGLPQPTGSGVEAWQEELRRTPPAAAELVEVPFREADAFLRGESVWVGSDLEGDLGDDDDPFDERQPVHGVLVQPDGSVEPTAAVRLRPGAILALPSSAGGHDSWGWTGKPGEHVLDVSDLAARRPRLRLRQAILNALIGDGAPDMPSSQADDDAAAENPRAFIDRVIAASGRAVVADGWYGRRLADRLRTGRAWWSVPPVADGVGRCFVARHTTSFDVLVPGASRSSSRDRRGDVKALPDEVGDAEDGASSAGTAVITLEQHLHDVEGRARTVGEALGLARPLVDAVALAGLVHDLGKADHRFQIMLHHGDRLRFEASGELLAKSGMDPADGAEFQRARRASGWPKGMRHEAVSAALVEALLLDSPDTFTAVDTDLVRHLVASHHGFSRPLLPAVADRSPCEVRVAFQGGELVAKSDALLIDWDAPSRFDRLCRTYGRWGVAMLEAVVRLADIAWSIEYQERAAAVADLDDAVLRQEDRE